MWEQFVGRTGAHIVGCDLSRTDEALTGRPNDARVMLTIPNQKHELEALTVRELQKLAAELEIRGRSKLRKAELVEEILETRKTDDLDAETDASGAVVDVTHAVETRAMEALEELPEILIIDDALDGEKTGEDSVSSTPTEENTVMARSSTHQVSEPGPSEITLLGVHSRRLFAYWQCDLGAVSHARATLADPDAIITLRFADITLIEFDNQRELSSVDIAVHSPAGNYYFNDIPPGHSFRCWVGLKASNGEFLELVCSETVETPHEFLTTVGAVEMATVRGADDGPWKPRSSEPVRPRPASPSRDSSSSEGDVPVADAAVEVRRDRAAPASAPNPNVETGPDQGTERSVPVPADAATAPHDRPSFEADVRPRFNFTPADVSRQVSSLDLVEGGPESSLGLAAPSSRLGGESSLGLVPLVERAPEADLSHEVTLNPDQPGLQLELHAELIVYGRASPEIQVVIDGVRVPVREDGRFDVRFALNHIPEERS